MDNARALKGVMPGSLWAGIGIGLRALTGFVSVPLTLSYLGNDRLGLWRLAVSSVSILVIFQHGLLPHLKTKMAEAFAVRDRSSFDEYASASIFMAGVCVTVGIVLAILCPLLDWARFFQVSDPKAACEALPLVMVVVFVSLAQCGGVFIESVYDAQLETWKPRAYGAVGILAGFALLLLGIQVHASLPWLVFLSSIPWALTKLPLLVELGFRRPQMWRIRTKRLIIILKELKGPSIVCAGISLGGLLVAAIPNFLIARHGNLADVAKFSVSYQLVSYPLMFLAGIMPVLWPTFTVIWKSGDYVSLRRWLIRGSAGTLGCLVVFTVTMGITGPWVIRLWTHGRISPDNSFLLLLCIAVSIQGCYYWFQTFLWSTNQLKWLFLSSSLATIFMFFLAFGLLPTCGLHGMAIAMVGASGLGVLLPTGWKVFHDLSPKRAQSARPAPAAAGGSAMATAEDLCCGDKS